MSINFKSHSKHPSSLLIKREYYTVLSQLRNENLTYNKSKVYYQFLKLRRKSMRASGSINASTVRCDNSWSMHRTLLITTKMFFKQPSDAKQTRPRGDSQTFPALSADCLFYFKFYFV